MRRFLFWGSIGLILYTYVGFPLLVLLRGLLRPRPVRSADVTPTVSLVVAARNEEATIAAKIENALAQDYPPDRLEVIIASDGSEDGTNAIVRSYAARGVRLLGLPRVGKNEALNAGAAAATGEILAFTDANSMFRPDAVRALVRPFADPTVGCVAGDQRYLTQRARQAEGFGERTYWSFDRLLKQYGTRGGNAISATGAIYAVRRSLVEPLPPAAMDDFVNSTRVITRGYRLVFEPAAVAVEPVATSNEIEFGRKVRVVNMGLGGVLAVRALLNPFTYGFYAVQLWSHKVFRRLVGLPLLVLLGVSPFLWRRGPAYRLATLGQLGWYGAAAAGWLLRDTRLGRNRLVAIPVFFGLVNLASLKAAWQVLTGRRLRYWEPRRDAEPATAPSAPTRRTEPAGEPESTRVTASSVDRVRVRPLDADPVMGSSVADPSDALGIGA
ncbi:MAG: glycosyltransferase family 2 protein [Chloroflexi bacterium]|nr:glycosyltransferase family 2 protein [Chloroflexota bacterium]